MSNYSMTYQEITFYNDRATGPSKHLSILKDRYRCQQSPQILRLDHRGQTPLKFKCGNNAMSSFV